MRAYARVGITVNRQRHHQIKSLDARNSHAVAVHFYFYERNIISLGRLIVLIALPKLKQIQFNSSEASIGPSPYRIRFCIFPARHKI